MGVGLLKAAKPVKEVTSDLSLEPGLTRHLELMFESKQSIKERGFSATC